MEQSFSYSTQDASPRMTGSIGSTSMTSGARRGQAQNVSKNTFWFCLSMACTVFMVILGLSMLVILNSGVRDADRRDLETKGTVGDDDARI
ncbi:hypothetical protein MTO96_037905 [Rhipicephalus appendiculatus]